MPHSEFPKDALGNELKVGRLVRIDLDKAYVIGTVVAVDQAGKIELPIGAMDPRSAAKANVGTIPGTIKIQVELTTAFAPGAFIKQMFVLQEPKEQSQPIAVTAS